MRKRSKGPAGFLLHPNLKLDAIMVFFSLQNHVLSTQFKFFSIAFFALILTACGFQLKGQLPIPQALTTLKLVSLSSMSTFDQSLKKALSLSGVSLIDEDAQVDNNVLELKVLKITYTDRVLSTASNNDVTEKERKMKVNYFIRNNTGKSLYGPRVVSISRTLSNQNASDDTVLAYNNEQMQDMADDLAKQLVNDLAYSSL